MPRRDLLDQMSDPRVGRQRARRDLLEGDIESQVRRAIERRYPDRKKRDEALVHLDVGFNLFEMAMHRMAVVYGRPVVRRFGDPGDSALWATVAPPHIDAIMQEVSRLAIATGVCFVQPFVRDDQISLTVIPADVAAATWLTRTSVSELLYYVDGERYAYWTADQWSVWQGDEMLSGGSHTLGRVPAVVYRSRYPGATRVWGSRTMESLAQAAVNICVSRTHLSQIRQEQAHLQLAREEEVADIGSTAALKPDQVHVGPKEVLEGRYQVLSLQADIAALTQAIEVDIRRAASAVGISEEMLTAKNYRSGLHSQQAHVQLQELREGLLRWFAPADLELMTVAAAAWNNVAGTQPIFVGSQPEVDYTQPQTVQEESEALDNAERKYAIGLESPVDWVLASDPQIRDRKAAMRHITKRLKESQEISELKNVRDIDIEHPAQPPAADPTPVGGDEQSRPNAASDGSPRSDSGG